MQFLYSPRNQEEILSLKFEEQKSYKEIAQATGLTLGMWAIKFITL